MAIPKDLIEVRVKVTMKTTSLQAIVANAKKIVGRNEKGHCSADTADWVGLMISRFLLENDFDSFAKEIENYPHET